MRETLRGLLAQATESLPAVRTRAMFGGTAWFVGGEMFALTWPHQIALKLSPEDRDRALSLEGARLFDPQGGRPMRSLVIMPPVTFGHPGTLAAWVHKSHAFASIAHGERIERRMERAMPADTAARREAQGEPRVARRRRAGAGKRAASRPRKGARRSR